MNGDICLDTTRSRIESDTSASRAYDRQSLVITTNLPFEQWPQVCGSERLTGAMLDRLTHRVHIVEANGESYRLKDSQRRMKRRRRAATKS